MWAVTSALGWQGLTLVRHVVCFTCLPCYSLKLVLKAAIDGKWNFIWGFTHEYSDQLYFVNRTTCSNNSWELMTWKHKMVSMFLTQIKNPNQTFSLSPVVALTVEMVSCSSQEPAYAGSQKNLPAALLPLHANGFILPLVLGQAGGLQRLLAAWHSNPGCSKSWWDLTSTAKPWQMFWDSVWKSHAVKLISVVIIQLVFWYGTKNCPSLPVLYYGKWRLGGWEEHPSLGASLSKPAPPSASAPREGALLHR